MYHLFFLKFFSIVKLFVVAHSVSLKPATHNPFSLYMGPFDGLFARALNFTQQLELVSRFYITAINTSGQY